MPQVPDMLSETRADEALGEENSEKKFTNPSTNMGLADKIISPTPSTVKNVLHLHSCRRIFFFIITMTSEALLIQ